MALLCAIGCGGGSAPAGGPGPDARADPALPPRPLAQVFVLEATGAMPDDTTVSVPAGQGRVVELRRSGPDYGLYARLVLPGGAPAATRGPVALTLRPRPGLYAMDVDVQGTLGAGATIEFSYGMHFVAPAGARERYGGDLEFERALGLGRLDGGTEVVFLATLRPGSDMLSAPFTVPGRYLVGAPR